MGAQRRTTTGAHGSSSTSSSNCNSSSRGGSRNQQARPVRPEAGQSGRDGQSTTAAGSAQCFAPCTTAGRQSQAQGQPVRKKRGSQRRLRGRHDALSHSSWQTQPGPGVVMQSGVDGQSAAAAGSAQYFEPQQAADTARPGCIQPGRDGQSGRAAHLLCLVRRDKKEATSAAVAHWSERSQQSQREGRRAPCYNPCCSAAPYRPRPTRKKRDKTINPGDGGPIGLCVDTAGAYSASSSLTQWQVRFIIGVNLPAGFDNFVRRFRTRGPCLFVELSLRNSVMEGLVLTPAPIRNRQNSLRVWTIELALLLCMVPMDHRSGLARMPLQLHVHRQLARAIRLCQDENRVRAPPPEIGWLSLSESHLEGLSLRCTGRPQAQVVLETARYRATPDIRTRIFRSRSPGVMRGPPHWGS